MNVTTLLLSLFVAAQCQSLVRYDYAPAQQVAHYALEYERDFRPIWRAAQLRGPQSSEGYSEDWFSVPSVMQDNDQSRKVLLERESDDNVFAFDQNNVFVFENGFVHFSKQQQIEN